MTDQSMAGKVCMVTGANAGIGKVTALELAKRGATVIMVSRSHTRGEEARQEIVAQSGNNAVELLVADLSSQASIRQLADQFKQNYIRLDVLINNAGAIFYQREETEDGLERTFAVNHIAYFLLTYLLLDLLKASAPARIINVSSDAHRMSKLDFDDLQSECSFSAFGAYGQSKLANILFTAELARRLEGSGVTANTVHPGFVQTNFGRSQTGIVATLFRVLNRLFAVSSEKGAETSVYLATAPEVEGVTGKWMGRARNVCGRRVNGWRGFNVYRHLPQ
jgi:NAD(P)-dependent dehydrogenase (short-subunit alcohol dehydrogenase family)